jgi:hypothetical protein
MNRSNNWVIHIYGAAVFAVAVIVAVALLNVSDTNKRLTVQAKQGENAHIAFCTLYDDLRTRVKTSRQFLVDHPKGIPGIPASVIRNGIDNQQKTVDALSVVLRDCLPK